VVQDLYPPPRADLEIQALPSWRHSFEVRTVVLATADHSACRLIKVVAPRAPNGKNCRADSWAFLGRRCLQPVKLVVSLDFATIRFDFACHLIIATPHLGRVKPLALRGRPGCWFLPDGVLGRPVRSFEFVDRRRELIRDDDEW